MQSNSLILHRRKEVVGTLAWIAWAVGLLATHSYSARGIGMLCLMAGWLLLTAWVALDDYLRRGRRFWWPLLTMLTGPASLALYYLLRQPAPRVCSRCGTTAPDSATPCPTCGHATLFARCRLAASGICTSISDPLVRGPVESAKETAKHLAFALVAAAIITFLLLQYAHPLSSQATLLGVIWALSAAAYWVLVAWWVYLDSAWRRMDGVPWAVLTLITNIIGLVTYLVIRYPDPRACVRCGASIPTGLKYCPFCGSEAEAMCPHCQAPIKSGWQYCPVCAARLTPSETTVEDAPAASGITIAGSVLDAIEGTPIADARVEIDSVADRQSVTTDSLGRFELAVPDQRPYVLVASCEGYTSQARPYSPGAKDARHLRFTLHRAVREEVP